MQLFALSKVIFCDTMQWLEDAFIQKKEWYTSVQNSATFPMLLLKSSKKVVILNEISRK